MSFLRAAVLAAAAAAARAQAPSWLGLRPSAGAPHSLELVDIGDNAVVNRVIGRVAIGADEYAWSNAVRCLPGPPGFCLFATSLMTAPGAAGNASFVYRIASDTAALVWRAPCPGICAHMHVDYTSTRAYTFSYEGPGGARAEILEIPADGGAPIQVADVTAAVAGGEVRPGQTTHCSAYQSMYVGVAHGGAGKDAVFAVDLTAGTPGPLVTLDAPLFDAMWGTCDGSGVIGGVSAAAAAGMAEFGTLDATGHYTRKSVVALAAGLVPSGMLAATSPNNYDDAFVAAFYPPATLTNNTAAVGALWAVDPYGGGADDFMTQINFVLIGAAWDRGG